MLSRVSNPLTACLLAYFALFAVYSPAQHQRGELRLDVHDDAGGALAAAVDVTSDINQLHRNASTDASGHYVALELPFGLYRISVSHLGFQTSTQVFRIEPL